MNRAFGRAAAVAFIFASIGGAFAQDHLAASRGFQAEGRLITASAVLIDRPTSPSDAACTLLSDTLGGLRAASPADRSGAPGFRGTPIACLRSYAAAGGQVIASVYTDPGFARLIAAGPPPGVAEKETIAGRDAYPQAPGVSGTTLSYANLMVSNGEAAAISLAYQPDDDAMDSILKADGGFDAAAAARAPALQPAALDVLRGVAADLPFELFGAQDAAAGESADLRDAEAALEELGRAITDVLKPTLFQASPDSTELDLDPVGRSPRCLVVGYFEPALDPQFLDLYVGADCVADRMAYAGDQFGTVGRYPLFLAPEEPQLVDGAPGASTAATIQLSDRAAVVFTILKGHEGAKEAAEALDLTAIKELL